MRNERRKMLFYEAGHLGSRTAIQEEAMNRRRRKEIERAVNEYLFAESAAREKLMMIIEEARDIEEEVYDNLPESLQDTHGANDMQEAIEALTSFYDELEEIDLNDAVSELFEACGIEE